MALVFHVCLFYSVELRASIAGVGEGGAVSDTPAIRLVRENLPTTETVGNSCPDGRDGGAERLGALRDRVSEALSRTG